MDTLVIGGSEFIGSNLSESLLARGYGVRIYSRNISRVRGALRGAEYVEGDLGNHGLIREALEGIDVVFHLASTTLPKTSNDDPGYDVRSNVVDTIQLLEACVDAGVRKVIFASSGGTVYGVPERLPIKEDHPTNPISSYGIVKLTIEKYLGLFHYLYGLDYAALRISNPYGPYQDPAGQQGAVSVFLHRILSGQPITIWGDGEIVRDYVYISDVVDALELAARSEISRKVLNVGSGRGSSLNEILEVISGIVRREPEVEYLPARSLDVPASVMDVGNARKCLGWAPEVDLVDGISRTWERIRNQPSNAP